VQRPLTILLALTLLVALPPSSLGQQGRAPGTNYSTALELTPGEHSFYLERGDTHYFSIRLEKDDTLYLQMRSALNQDFDMALVSPERDVIELSLRPAGFTERITYTAQSSGLYFIVVFPFGPSSGAYSLLIGISKPRVTVQTETVTALAYITVTHKDVRDFAVILTRESYRTVTVTTTIQPDQGYQLLGLAVISLALIAVGAIIRDGLLGARRFGDSRSEGAPGGAKALYGALQTGLRHRRLV